MSRRYHISNKSKPVVRKSTAARCKRWGDVLQAFMDKPWSADPTVNAALHQRLQKGRMEIVSMMINEWCLFGIVLESAMKVFEIGITATRIKADDWVYTDMTTCSEKNKHFTADVMNGNISSMFSRCNRMIKEHVAKWKRDRILELDSIELPEFVENTPQIDIDIDPSLFEVKKLIIILKNRCLLFRGKKGKKCKEILNRDQVCHIAANIWDRAFSGVPGKDNINTMNISRINPTDLTALLIWEWHTYKTGRGGGSARDIQWDRDIDFTTINNGFIEIYPWGKDVGIDSNKTKVRKIKPAPNGKGLYALLLLVKSVRPTFLNETEADKKTLKYQDVAFLQPLKRMKYDKRTEKWVAFGKTPIGKNSFDSYYQRACSLCDVDYKGSVYSCRFSMVSVLTAAGVPFPEIKKYWTTHSSSIALEGYYDSTVAQESELDSQDKFRNYVEQNKHNLNNTNTSNNTQPPLSQLHTMPQFDTTARPPIQQQTVHQQQTVLSPSVHQPQSVQNTSVHPPSVHQPQSVQNTSVHPSVHPSVTQPPQPPSIPYIPSRGLPSNASNNRYTPYNTSLPSIPNARSYSNHCTSSTVSTVSGLSNISVGSGVGGGVGSGVGNGPLQCISNNIPSNNNNYTSCNILNGSLQPITNEIPYFGSLPITGSGFNDNDFVFSTGKVHDVYDSVQNENACNQSQIQLQPVYGYSIMEEMNEREQNLNSVNNTYQQQFF